MKELVRENVERFAMFMSYSKPRRRPIYVADHLAMFSVVIGVSSMVNSARTTFSGIGTCFGASGSGRRLIPST